MTNRTKKATVQAPVINGNESTPLQRIKDVLSELSAPEVVKTVIALNDDLIIKLKTTEQEYRAQLDQAYGLIEQFIGSQLSSEKRLAELSSKLTR